MTRSGSRASAIAALGAAVLVSLTPIFAALADTTTAPAQSVLASTLAPASSAAATPSLSEPAPTPGWAEAGPGHAPVAQQRHVRRYVHRRYAYWPRYRSDNPVATAATGVAGGVADLGSIAAYPFYCFPNYGSCSVRVPYRF